MTNLCDKHWGFQYFTEDPCDMCEKDKRIAELEQQLASLREVALAVIEYGFDDYTPEGHARWSNACEALKHELRQAQEGDQQS